MDKESRFLRALGRLPVDRTPVWIMRQAGRYLPEYRKMRAQAKDFLTLCKTPELACEVTLLPLKRYSLDAAILFSDILMLPEAMGLNLTFTTGEGPCFAKTVRSIADVQQLPDIEPRQQMSYMFNAIRLLRQELPSNTPLIGFAGSPWTVATYMVEGKSSKNFMHIKKWMYKDATGLHKLLCYIAEQTSKLLQAQVEAGAQVLMLFDTWGGVLAQPQYLQFSLQYMAKIVESLKISCPNIPIILFSKNGGDSLFDIAATGCDAIGLDWVADLASARQQVGHKVALQGNLDPCVLYADPKQIEVEVQRVLQNYGSGPGHIFNLGHGIHPEVLPENMQALVDAVQMHSPAFHA